MPLSAEMAKYGAQRPTSVLSHSYRPTLLAGEAQAAVTAHAKGEDKPRFEVEAAVRTTARHPEAATA